MELSDKVAAVSRMQKYISEHTDGDVTLDEICLTAGYSKYHAVRIFKELTGKTPFETIRALRLTSAAKTLRDTDIKVVDIAMAEGFDSHDGFTRAFTRQFGITPRRYSREMPPISGFIQYPIDTYYLMQDGEHMTAENLSKIVTVTAVERPGRKLILLMADKAAGGDYMAFCEEMGCEWEGVLNSIPVRFDDAALLSLPSGMARNRTSNTAVGVEVPADYAKQIPQGYDMVELPPCTMLYFHGTPYTDENDFCVAITVVSGAVNSYDPSLYGWRYAPEIAPKFNFGASVKLGARMAVPVTK